MKGLIESFDFDNANIESLVDDVVDEYKIVRQFSELIGKTHLLKSKDKLSGACIDISYDDDIELLIERPGGIIYSYWLYGTSPEEVRKSLNRLIVDRKIEKFKILQTLKILVNDNSHLLESFDFEDEETFDEIEKRIEIYNPDKLYDVIADLALLNYREGKDIPELLIKKSSWPPSLFVTSTNSKGKTVCDEIILASEEKDDIVADIKEYVEDFFLSDEDQEEFVKVLRGIALKYCSLLESFDFDSEDLGIEDSIENRIESLNIGKLIERTKEFVNLAKEAYSKKLIGTYRTYSFFYGPDLKALWSLGRIEMMIKLYPKNKMAKDYFKYAINLRSIPYVNTAENKLAIFSRYEENEWKPLTGSQEELIELNDLILYNTEIIRKALSLLTPSAYEAIENLTRLMSQRRVSFIEYTNQHVSYRNGPYCLYDDPNPFGIIKLDAPELVTSWCDLMLDVDSQLDSEEYVEWTLKFFNPFGLQSQEYKNIIKALEECWNI